MRVFISLPMSGRTDKEVFTEIEGIKKIFTEYANEELPDEEIIFVDTYVQQSAPDICVTEPLWYLGESIKIMSTCDAVIFAPGWAMARGCKIEHDTALEYGIQRYKLGYTTNTRSLYIRDCEAGLNWFVDPIEVHIAT